MDSSLGDHTLLRRFITMIKFMFPPIHTESSPFRLKQSRKCSIASSYYRLHFKGIKVCHTMSSPPTAKDICDSIPTQILDSTVSDKHVADIVKHFHEWQEMAPYLDLTEADQHDIQEIHRNSPELMRKEALQRWKQINGSKATYRRLIVIFCSQRRTDVAEKLRDLTKQIESDQKSEGELEKFADHLRESYVDPEASNPSKWPFTTSINYVDLELYDAPIVNTEGRPKGSQQGSLKPITVASMLSAGKSRNKKKVILVEGVSGSGKTTLSRYACRQWALGEILKDINLLIRIAVNDPDIQSAKELADLIPHSDEKVRKSIADEIAVRKGKGICFILDACDEAPQMMQQESFLRRFIVGSGRLTLPNVSIFLFSRPGMALEYQECLTGKITVKGFTLDSLHTFVEKRYEGDVSKLLLAFEMKPELETLCCVPLNAVIFVFLYDCFEENLPTTSTELFHPLLCNILRRHMKERKKMSIRSVRNLPRDLPSDVAEHFKKLSEIAFLALTEGKVTVDQAFLESYNFSATEDSMLSLLHVSHQMVAMFEDEQHYSFEHLSVQEFMAAFHISLLDTDKQIEAFQVVYHQNPLSPILTFYSGLTNLTLPEVQDVLLKALSGPTDSSSILRQVLLHSVPSKDIRRHLLALANCLYECNNNARGLWNRVVSDISEDKRIPLASKNTLAAFDRVATSEGADIPNCNFTLSFEHMELLPTDMLSLGKLSCVIGERIPEDSLLNLELSHCTICNTGFDALSIELSKEVERSKVVLSLCGVRQSNSTAMSLKRSIQGRTSVATLMVSSVPWQHRCESEFFLKRIIEGLSANSACVSLTLCSMGIGASHIHSLLLLLVSTQVTGLFLDNNDLRRGMNLFSSAILCSKVGLLSLSNCNINDSGLLLLGESLCKSQSDLLFLHIEYNPITQAGLQKYLELILTYRPRLQALGTSIDLNREHSKLIRQINKSGRRHPLLVHNLIGQDSQSVASNKSINTTFSMQAKPELSHRPRHHIP